MTFKRREVKTAAAAAAAAWPAGRENPRALFIDRSRGALRLAGAVFARSANFAGQ